MCSQAAVTDVHAIALFVQDGKASVLLRQSRRSQQAFLGDNGVFKLGFAVGSTSAVPQSLAVQKISSDQDQNGTCGSASLLQIIVIDSTKGVVRQQCASLHPLSGAIHTTLKRRMVSKDRNRDGTNQSVNDCWGSTTISSNVSFVEIPKIPCLTALPKNPHTLTLASSGHHSTDISDRQ